MFYVWVYAFCNFWLDVVVLAEHAKESTLFIKRVSRFSHVI